MSGDYSMRGGGAMRWMAALLVLMVLAVAGAPGAAPSRTVEEARAILEETGAKPRQIFAGEGHVGSVWLGLRPGWVMALVTVVPTNDESVDLAMCDASLWRGGEVVEDGPHIGDVARDLACEGSQSLLVSWKVDSEPGADEELVVLLFGGGVDFERVFRGAAAKRQSARTAELAAAYEEALEKQGDGEEADDAAEDGEEVAGGSPSDGKLEWWCGDGGKLLMGKAWQGCASMGGMDDRAVMAIVALEGDGGAAPKLGKIDARRGTAALPLVEVSGLFRHPSSEKLWLAMAMWSLESPPAEGDTFALELRVEGETAPMACSFGAAEMEKEKGIFLGRTGLFFMRAEEAGAVPEEGAEVEEESAEPRTWTVDALAEHLLANGVAAKQIAKGKKTVTTLLLMEQSGMMWGIACVGQMAGSAGKLAPEGLVLLRNGKAMEWNAANGATQTLRPVTSRMPGTLTVAAMWSLGKSPVVPEDVFELRAKGTDVDGSATFTGAELIALREREAKAAEEEKLPRRIGKLYGETLMAEGMEDHTAEGSDATSWGTIMVAREGNVRLRVQVYAAALRGKPLDLPLTGVRLERSGHYVRFETLNDSAELDTETDGVPTTTATLDLSWRFKSVPQADEKFVVTVKGDGVDLRREFTWGEVGGDKDWFAEEKEEDEAAAAADDAEASAAAGDGVQAAVACKVIGGRFFVPVAIETGGERRDLVLALDEKAEKTAVPASAMPAGTREGKMTVEVGGIAREMEVALLPAGTPGVLSAEVFAGMEYVLDEAGSRIVLRGAGAEAASKPAPESAKVAPTESGPETARSKALAMLKAQVVADDAIFESDAAVTSVSVLAPDRARVSVVVTAMELPGHAVELEASDLKMTRNGEELLWPIAPESMAIPRRGRNEPRAVIAGSTWLLQEALVMPDDRYVLTAKGKGVDLRYEFGVEELIAQGRFDQRAVVEELVADAKEQGERAGAAAVPKGMTAITLVKLEGNLVAVVGIEIGGKRAGEALLRVGSEHWDQDTALVPNSALAEGTDLSGFAPGEMGMAESGPIGVAVLAGRATLVVGPRRREVTARFFEDGFVRRGQGVMPASVLGDGHVVDEENMRILVKAE